MDVVRFENSLTVATLNAGGFKQLDEGADPTRVASYTTDCLDRAIDLFRKLNLDVIALQEIQLNEETGFNQGEHIARALGYYCVSDFFSESHKEASLRLGQCLITRFAPMNHRSGQFWNPRKTVIWEDGSSATSFDKGHTSCDVVANGKPVTLTTAHPIPLRRFEIELDSELGQKIRQDMSESLLLQQRHPDWVIAADLNLYRPSVAEALSPLFEQAGLQELDMHKLTDGKGTNPKGHYHDTVLYSKDSFVLSNSFVDLSLNVDHTLVVAQLAW